jgi:NAD(P) transhydrogenase subunit beta
MASLVVIVPGYGLAGGAGAAARARALRRAHEARAIEVRFAIHPVAGRMPGHMNVLLAEADIPYDKLGRDGRHQPEHAAVRRRW